MRELKKDINYMHRKNEFLLKKTDNGLVCKNINLIRKLAPTITNSITIYADEILELLLDEILTEEVIYILIIIFKKIFLKN